MPDVVNKQHKVIAGKASATTGTVKICELEVSQGGNRGRHSFVILRCYKKKSRKWRGGRSGIYKAGR